MVLIIRVLFLILSMPVSKFFARRSHIVGHMLHVNSKSKLDSIKRISLSLKLTLDPNR